MTYEKIFDKYFALSKYPIYSNMFEHLHETTYLYIHILIFMTAIDHRNVNPTYNKLQTITSIYADSYMIKIRQLLTTNKRENSLLYQFYRDLLSVENRAYYRKDFDWLTTHYKDGPVDKYQKLEIHSNFHIKHYRRTDIGHHKGRFTTSYYLDPLSFKYITRTDPYLSCILRTIYNYRRKSKFYDLGYSPIDLDGEILQLESTYGFSLTKSDYSQVYKKVAKINEALYGWVN